MWGRMKGQKTCAVLLAAALLFLCACGENESQKQDSTISEQHSEVSSIVTEESVSDTEAENPTNASSEPEDLTEPEDAYDEITSQAHTTVPFYDLLSEINASRIVETDTLYHDAMRYVINDDSFGNALIQEDVDLLHGMNTTWSILSAAEAREDVGLCFRALREGYGAYFYFGEDAFHDAEQQVMNWIDQEPTITPDALGLAIRQSLEYMRDGHSYVYSPYSIAFGRYHSFIEADLLLEQDDQGDYYIVSDEERWRIRGFSDDRVTIEKVLLETGEVSYAPTLCSQDDTIGQSFAEIENSDGKLRIIQMYWSKLNAISSQSYNVPDYHFLDEDGIAYISMRAFWEDYFPDIYADFIGTGFRARNSKAVVFDLRGNGGGNGESMINWIRNFTGATTSSAEFRVSRSSRLRLYPGANYGNYTSPKSFSAAFAENDTPIIILVDENCGSAGEYALNLLRNIKNSVVVGSYSFGAQLGGNTVELRLPNSGIQCVIGTELRFVNTTENVDCKGYAPDIWCDPNHALDAVIEMLEYYELTDNTDAMKDELPSVKPSQAQDGPPPFAMADQR